MKKIPAILMVIFAMSAFVLAADDAQVLEFKAKVGFTNGEDKIIEHKFIDNDKKLLIMGQKSLQIWDVETAKLIVSVPHQIPQFAPRGFVSNYLLLNLPAIIDWRPYIIDDQGKWIITIEKIGTGEKRSAIVRDLENLKQKALLELPTNSTEYVAYDKSKNEVMTLGVTSKLGEFAAWDRDKLTRKEFFAIDEYKWHQKIRGDEKMIVGAGDTKGIASGWNVKQGDSLTLRDVKTGTIEKEYTAANLKPATYFQETTISADEKYMISKRDNRIFVWELAGDGKPKYEVSNPNPKGDFSLKEIVERRFIVVKIDEQLRVYDIEKDAAPILAVAPQNKDEDLYFQQIFNDRYVLVKAENKLRIYDTVGVQKLKFEMASTDPEDTMELRDFSKDEKYIAVNDDDKVFVYEISGDGKPLFQIVRDSPKERFYTIQFIEEKNWLAVARVNRSEKKEPRTEFYELQSGKLNFELPFEASEIKFTPDDRFIYQENIGSFLIWNLAEQKLSRISLKSYTPTHEDPVTKETVQDPPVNTDDISFSPDFRYILRYGDSPTAIFEVETGKQIQTIFDPQKVKYDKQNRLKDSGLGAANWINNGKYVYAFESPKFFVGTQRTINFWEVKK